MGALVHLTVPMLFIIRKGVLVMAELTKIFTGMEKGPEAIQANFDLMKSDLMNSKTAITTISLTPTAGATDPCIMTVIGETLVNLQFNGRYPLKGGIEIYWIDAKYAPKTSVSFAIPHNNTEGTQMIITIGSNGAVILVGNTDDKSMAFGSYTYNCKA